MRPKPGETQQRYYRCGWFDMSKTASGWWITLWPRNMRGAKVITVQRDRWIGLGWFGMLRIVKEVDVIK